MRNRFRGEFSQQSGKLSVQYGGGQKPSVLRQIPLERAV
jgi:hypothetical protein